MAKLPPFVQKVTLKGGLRYRGYAQDPTTGKRVYSKLFEAPEKAYTAALRMRRIAADGTPGVPIGDAVKALLQEVEAKRTAGTLAFYRTQFAAISRYFDDATFLHDITRERVEQFVRDRLRDYAKKPREATETDVGEPGRRLDPATVNKHLAALRRLFRVAIRMGLHTGENPAAFCETLRADSKPMDFFDLAELARLFGRVDDQAATDLFTLFAMTGIRRSEASRIRPEHVRGTTLFVCGKRRTRVVPIAPDARDAVLRLAFPLPLQRIDETFRHWRRRLKERKLHPHALRHTFGTALARQGERPDVIMHLMGHSNLQMTLRYLHECGAESAAAVGRLRLLPPSSAKQGLPG